MEGRYEQGLYCNGVTKRHMQSGARGIQPHHFGRDARIAKDDLHL